MGTAELQLKQQRVPWRLQLHPQPFATRVPLTHGVTWGWPPRHLPVSSGFPRRGLGRGISPPLRPQDLPQRGTHKPGGSASAGPQPTSCPAKKNPGRRRPAAGECQAPALCLFTEVNAGSLFGNKASTSGPRAPLTCCGRCRVRGSWPGLGVIPGGREGSEHPHLTQPPSGGPDLAS